MAHENEIDPILSGASSVPDPRGEDLASDRLPEAEPYTIAPDEDEAEELRPADGTDADDDEIVEDPEQLAEAEEEAREAPSTDPLAVAANQSRRPKRKSVVADADADAEPAAADDALAAGPGATSLRPKKRASGELATTGEGALDSPHRRTGPVQFVKESVAELRKVVWPTGSQLSQYFVVVLVFVLFIIAYVTLLDAGFGSLLMHFLGGA